MDNHLAPTWLPILFHLTSTQPILHWISTWKPLDIHSTSTWHPLNIHLTSTWHPLDIHSTFPRHPLDIHSTSTWHPLDYHFTTTSLPIDYHFTTTWLPLNNIENIDKITPSHRKNWPKIRALAQILARKGIPFENFRRRLSTNEKPRFRALDQSQASISGKFYSSNNFKGCHCASIQPVKARWKLFKSHILFRHTLEAPPLLRNFINPIDIHLTTTWLPLDYHLTTTWLPLAFHLPTTWGPLDCQLTSTWLPLECHLTANWLPLDYHLTATWLPLDYHLTTTWLPLDYHLSTTWVPLNFHLTTTWLPLDYFLTTTWGKKKKVPKLRPVIGRELRIKASHWSRASSENIQRRDPYGPESEPLPGVFFTTNPISLDNI